APAPDRVDHRAVGRRRRIDETHRRVGTEIAGQLERELNARRELCEALINPKLEPERALIVLPDDAGGDQRHAGGQHVDLALAPCGEVDGGAANESGVALVLHQRSTALALPAAGLERKKRLDCMTDAFACSGDGETEGADIAEAVSLAAQFLELL